MQQFTITNLRTKTPTITSTIAAAIIQQCRSTFVSANAQLGNTIQLNQLSQCFFDEQTKHTSSD